MFGIRCCEVLSADYLRQSLGQATHPGRFQQGHERNARSLLAGLYRLYALFLHTTAFKGVCRGLSLTAGMLKLLTRTSRVLATNIPACNHLMLACASGPFIAPCPRSPLATNHRGVQTSGGRKEGRKGHTSLRLLTHDRKGHLA